MSTGPGRVEQAIRGMIADKRVMRDAVARLERRIVRATVDQLERQRQQNIERVPLTELVGLRVGSDEACRAAFGEPPWKRTQQVSAQRAMRRIAEREGGWRTERGSNGHRVVFVYAPPAGSEPADVSAAARATEWEPEQAASEAEQPGPPVQPEAGAAEAEAAAAAEVRAEASSEPPAVDSETKGAAAARAEVPPELPALPVVSSLPAPGRLPKSAATVTVACKLPMGLWMRVQEVYERRVAAPGGFMVEQAARDIGEPILIKGTAHVPNRMPNTPLEEGYALTFGVPADIWARWYEQNRDSALVRNHMIFAHGSDTAGQAREYRDMKSGLEPLHRDSSGELDDRRVPQPIDPLIGAVSTAKRS
jgi:hypothetical protein